MTKSTLPQHLPVKHKKGDFCLALPAKWRPALQAHHRSGDSDSMPLTPNAPKPKAPNPKRLNPKPLNPKPLKSKGRWKLPWLL